MTQPRARINVSCSRAGHKGVAGGLVDHLEGWFPCQQRVGTGPGTGQGGTGTSEIADEIAPLIHSVGVGCDNYWLSGHQWVISGSLVTLQPTVDYVLGQPMC